ncbi:hypothetical protein BP6252_10673 [Coleophoma cylindrospora]|uniref:Uncharacterized protein n=1 Tax=Coleophoma cylindrospora TaxID=1849047 RepID=A0A3D8QTC3_9HELO|nr:hypothetical protein BP6252_10673 [Coleophoma cylindrospora]
MGELVLHHALNFDGLSYTQAVIILPAAFGDPFRRTVPRAVVRVDMHSSPLPVVYAVRRKGSGLKDLPPIHPRRLSQVAKLCYRAACIVRSSDTVPPESTPDNQAAYLHRG